MPNPNSTSAPVEGVVVLAPSTPVDGFDALLEVLDTVEVDVEGSVTVVVRPVEDCELVVCDVVVSLDVVVGVLTVDDVVLLEVVVGVLTVDDVLLLDEVVLLDDEVVCELDDELLLDVVLCVLLVVLCVLLEDDVVEFVEDVVVVALEPPAQVLERTKSPLPPVSSAAVPSASLLSSMIPVSGTHAHERVAPPSASTTTALYPPSFCCWTYVTVNSLFAPAKLALNAFPLSS